MSYVEGTIHGQGFTRIFVPRTFEPQDIVHQATGLGASSVKAQGLTMVEQGFAILDPQLARHDYAVGDTLTIADAALFYVERWAPQSGITLPANLQRHFERMLSRPAVQCTRCVSCGQKSEPLMPVRQAPFDSYRSVHVASG